MKTLLTFPAKTPQASGMRYRHNILMGVVMMFMCAACGHVGGGPTTASGIKHCQPELNGDGSIRRMICR